VVCASDDGWWYYPKHVEQFPDKINCVTLHLVGYILEYNTTDFAHGSYTELLYANSAIPSSSSLHGIYNYIHAIHHFLGHNVASRSWYSDEVTGWMVPGSNLVRGKSFYSKTIRMAHPPSCLVGTRVLSRG